MKKKFDQRGEGAGLKFEIWYNCSLRVLKQLFFLLLFLLLSLLKGTGLLYKFYKVFNIHEVGSLDMV